MVSNTTTLIVLLFALAIVTFWRAVIKYLIMIAATAVIAAFGYGAVIIWQGMHHIAK